MCSAYFPAGVCTSNLLSGECPALLDSYPLASRKARADNDEGKFEVALI